MKMPVSHFKSSTVEAERTPLSHQAIQSDKMDILEVLAPCLTHDVNNPSNLIMLNTDVVNDMWNEILPILDEHARRNPSLTLGGQPYYDIRATMEELLTKIIKGSERISEIASVLNGFVRRESGKGDQLVNMNQSIQTALLLTGTLISKSGIRFESSIEPTLPPIRGNMQQLQHIFLGIITYICSEFSESHGKLSLEAFTSGGGLVFRFDYDSLSQELRSARSWVGQPRIEVLSNLVEANKGTISLSEGAAKDLSIVVSFPIAWDRPDKGGGESLL